MIWHNCRKNLYLYTRSFNELHQKINIIVSVYYLITELTIICKNKMFVSINWSFYYPFPELVIFFSLKNIRVIEWKIIYEYHVSPKFPDQYWYFQFFKCTFFLTQIYLPLTKSTRKLIIAKKANIYLPALRFKIYILYQNVCCQSRYV